jgi:hypothetical protein
MGLANPTLGFAFGLIVSKASLKSLFFPRIKEYINIKDETKYGGFGNTSKNIDNMFSLLINQGLIPKDNAEGLLNIRLIPYLNKYSNILCEKFIDIIRVDNSPETARLEFHNQILQILLSIVQPIINKMGIIASIVLEDPMSIVDPEKQELCNMGSLPLLQTKKIKYYTETPSLFDFVAVLLISLHPDYTKDQYLTRLNSDSKFKDTVLYYFNVMFNLLSHGRSFNSIIFE